VNRAHFGGNRQRVQLDRILDRRETHLKEKTISRMEAPVVYSSTWESIFRGLVFSVHLVGNLALPL